MAASVLQTTVPERAGVSGLRRLLTGLDFPSPLLANYFIHPRRMRVFLQNQH